MHYDDRVCLRHMLTRKYLTLRAAAGAPPTYTLTSNRTDANAAFRFKAVGSDEAAIKLGSFARIQHALSGTWLHGAKDEPVARVDHRCDLSTSQQSEFAARIAQMQWDKAPLIQIGVSPERRFDDAFVLYGASPDHVFNVHYVAGCLPYLHKFTRDRAAGDVPALEMHQYVVALTELAEFLLVDGLESAGMRMSRGLTGLQEQAAAEAAAQSWRGRPAGADAAHALPKLQRSAARLADRHPGPQPARARQHQAGAPDARVAKP